MVSRGRGVGCELRAIRAALLGRPARRTESDPRGRRAETSERRRGGRGCRVRAYLSDLRLSESSTTDVHNFRSKEDFSRTQSRPAPGSVDAEPPANQPVRPIIVAPMSKFRVGSSVLRREVLHGQVWMTMPAQVIADDDVLAVWIEDGTPLAFPPHPFGPHPWSGQDRWTGSSVLQLYRPTDAYSVWAFFNDGRRDCWYINFERPYSRGDDYFDTDDHGLDIVVKDGDWQWKDRDDVAGQVASGRLTPTEADAVWREAAHVAHTLDHGIGWWFRRWKDWIPVQ